MESSGVPGQIQVSEAQVTAARATVKQRVSLLKQAQVDLERTIIRAPVDGTVILRNVDAGQTVAASLQAPVLFPIAQELRAVDPGQVLDNPLLQLPEKLPDGRRVHRVCPRLTRRTRRARARRFFASAADCD